MRAISLDIDGVLHPTDAIDGLDLPTLALQGASALTARGLFRWCKNLQRVLDQAQADDVLLVVHSNWRHMRWISDSLIRAALGPLGSRYQGTTGDGERDRQLSIEACFKRAQIDDYIVVDDDPHAFRPDALGLIVTNPLKGLSDPGVLAKICAWARGKDAYGEPDAAILAPSLRGPSFAHVCDSCWADRLQLCGGPSA